MENQAKITNREPIEVSVVMPCLNEEQTIGLCIEKALQAFETYDILGEVIVADNGSTDSSVEIAESLGARVVHQPERGYGNAYLKGFAEAKGKYIIMGDSDNTYDFSEIDKFLQPLQNGYDFVSGNRLKSKIMPGAMPWLHKHIGNPFLSGFLNLLFHTGLSDAYCGMRGFTKEAYEQIRPISAGMEFNLELLINAAKSKLRMTEMPITLHPRKGESKLRTFRDGWRSLRFMLLYSPNHLFLLPGILLFILGALGMVILTFGSINLFGHTLGIHFLVLTSVLTLLGFQILHFWLCAKTYSLAERFEADNTFLLTFYKYFTLEKGIILGIFLFLVGFNILALILYKWIVSNFGPLYQEKPALFALTLIVIGVQTVFTSFFISAMSIKKAAIGDQ